MLFLAEEYEAEHTERCSHCGRLNFIIYCPCILFSQQLDLGTWAWPCHFLALWLWANNSLPGPQFLYLQNERVGFQHSTLPTSPSSLPPPPWLHCLLPPWTPLNSKSLEVISVCLLLPINCSRRESPCSCKQRQNCEFIWIYIIIHLIIIQLSWRPFKQKTIPLYEILPSPHFRGWGSLNPFQIQRH